MILWHEVLFTVSWVRTHERACGHGLPAWKKHRETAVLCRAPQILRPPRAPSLDPFTTILHPIKCLNRWSGGNCSAPAFSAPRCTGLAWRTPTPRIARPSSEKARTSCWRVRFPFAPMCPCVSMRVFGAVTTFLPQRWSGGAYIAVVRELVPHIAVVRHVVVIRKLLWYGGGGLGDEGVLALPCLPCFPVACEAKSEVVWMVGQRDTETFRIVGSAARGDRARRVVGWVMVVLPCVSSYC